MAEPALEIADLVVGYDGTPALRGVSLTVSPGEVLALLGPSGSGKSTRLHAVAGFLSPTAGTVRLGGTVAAGNGAYVPPERRDLGVVFQNYALWPHLCALDIVAYPVRRRGARRAQARTEALAIMARLRIDHLSGRRPAELSGGEQQRVGLARALARRPSLYLFDEPTAHLDTHVRAVFLEELAARRRDTGAANRAARARTSGGLRARRSRTAAGASAAWPTAWSTTGAARRMTRLCLTSRRRGRPAPGGAGRTGPRAPGPARG